MTSRELCAVRRVAIRPSRCNSLGQNSMPANERRPVQSQSHIGLTAERWARAGLKLPSRAAVLRARRRGIRRHPLMSDRPGRAPASPISTFSAPATAPLGDARSSDTAGARDGGDAPAQRRQGVAFTGRRYIGADHLRRGGHRQEAVLLAPGLVVREVRGIRPGELALAAFGGASVTPALRREHKTS
jgi:hypothetical protein